MLGNEGKCTELLAHLQKAHNDILARTLLLEAAFTSITDGILVCDRTGQIIQMNAAMSHFLNMQQKTHPEFFQLPFQERMAQFHAVDEHGQPFTLETWPLARLLRGEYLRNGHNGDMHLFLPDHKEVFFSYAGAPMHDPDGQVIGAVLTIHDVTERHLFEGRIQKSFHTLLALAEELTEVPEGMPAEEKRPEGYQPSLQTVCERVALLTCQMVECRGISISLIDSDPERLHMVAIVGSTAESRTGYYEKYADVLLTDILDEDAITHLHHNEPVIRDLALRLTSTNPYTLLLAPMMLDARLVGILSVEKKDPHHFYTHEEVCLIKAIAKFILLVIERERAQHEWLASHASELALREANQRFDEFLSIASHELRTPLAGMKGNIQLALRRLKTLTSNTSLDIALLLEKLEKVQEFLREAEDRVTVQNRMISDLLDVSRIQASKLEVVMASCDLVKIVHDAVLDEQNATPTRRIIMKTSVDERIPITGDADRLGQVVHNYVSNAVKYSPADQPIAISIEKVVDVVRVSVRDQGPGLTLEEQKRVWERFYRVKGVVAQGSSSPGLGLGLHICQTIIDAHQGQIGLESAPGQGSIFWFSLPLASPALST